MSREYLDMAAICTLTEYELKNFIVQNFSGFCTKWTIEIKKKITIYFYGFRILYVIKIIDSITACMLWIQNNIPEYHMLFST